MAASTALRKRLWRPCGMPEVDRVLAHPAMRDWEQQALAWAMKKNVELVQLADNFMPFRWIVVK